MRRPFQQYIKPWKSKENGLGSLGSIQTGICSLLPVLNRVIKYFIILWMCKKQQKRRFLHIKIH
jgi:hypothetical protein